MKNTILTIFCTVVVTLAGVAYLVGPKGVQSLLKDDIEPEVKYEFNLDDEETPPSKFDNILDDNLAKEEVEPEPEPEPQVEEKKVETKKQETKKQEVVEGTCIYCDGPLKDTDKKSVCSFCKSKMNSTKQCTYCRSTIIDDDGNGICKECEYESWSWHCTHCDSALTQSEYDEGSGMCGSCKYAYEYKQNNSPYGICDLCGESITQGAYGMFIQGDQDFCSGECLEEFFN